MPIFTDGPIVRRGKNLLDDIEVGQWDAAKAAAEQQWTFNPLPSARRNAELTRAEEGELERQGFPAYGVPEIRREPETPLIDAADARQRVTDAGMDLRIPDEGIREGVLDILMERKREELERQFVLSNAPGSTVPLQFLAGFAAGAVDPINVASAFVPVVGQARYTAMLANASTRAARLGVRARVGALQGAAGAALVEPITLSAASREQADYGLTDALTNVAFGAALGGGLHTIGGAISDWRARRLAEPGPPGLQDATFTPVTRPVNRAEVERLAFADDPIPSLSRIIRQQLEQDAPGLQALSVRQAGEELLPALRGELEGIAAGRLPNVRSLKAEQASVQNDLGRLGDSFRERAKRHQRENRMSRKQAEAAARRDIAAERERLTQRDTEISEQLDVNRQAELARGDLARIRRGEIPERFRTRVQERADQIARGFEFSGTARAVAEASPWPIRQAALRSAVAQSTTGRQVDVAPIFALNDPAQRPAAVAQLKESLQNPRQGRADPEGQRISRQIEEREGQPDGTDLESQQALLDDELAITEEISAQADFDLSAALRESDELVKDSNVFAAAWRAAAICGLRT